MGISFGHILNYVPGVSNVKGAIEGNAGQALLGPGYQAVKDVGKGLYGNSLSATDTAQLDEDRQRALDMYKEREAQMQAGQPTVNPQEAGRADNVSYNTPGPVERYSAAQTAAPRDVQVGNLSPVERVQSRDVNAAQAGYDHVNGAQVDTSQAQQSRDQQSQYLQLLQDRAAGKGPSVAESSYLGKLGDVQRGVLGAAATARGSDRSYARLHAMSEIGDQTRRAAMDAGQLRAQEAAGATGALGSTLSDVRGADINQATTQAQLNQQAALQGQTVGADVSKYNAGQRNSIAETDANRALAAQTTNAGAGNARTMDVAKLQTDVAAGNANRTVQNDQFNAAAQTGANAANTAAFNTRQTDTAHQQLTAATTNQSAGNQNSQYNAGQRQNAEVQTIQAQQGQQQILGGQQQTASDAAAGVTSAKLGVETADKERRAKTADSAISGITTLATGGLTKIIGGGGPAAGAAASDRRAKKDISRDSDREVDDALKKIELYQYRYKDPSDGEGERHGPMAQDLERNPILRSVVSSGPDGKKVVDTSALSLVMAGLTARKLRELDRRA